MEHLNIKIYGRVQGVFYRYTARKKAKELGILGFTRNETDGSVYIEAEGGKEPLKNFVAWCRRGPIGAAVKTITAEKEEVKNYKDFKIL